MKMGNIAKCLEITLIIPFFFFVLAAVYCHP